jgi:hypothetical protein
MPAKKPTRGLDFRREHYAPHPNTFIAAPTGLLSFGIVPQITTRDGEVIETGEIRLRFGEHWGPNHGYGIHHILQEHPKVALANPSAILSVAQFVASVIQPKADIHCEFASMRGRHRPVVIKRPHGQVVLEPMHDREIGVYYSVITAIPTTKAKGPKIGAL